MPQYLLPTMQNMVVGVGAVSQQPWLHHLLEDLLFEGVVAEGVVVAMITQQQSGMLVQVVVLVVIFLVVVALLEHREVHQPLDLQVPTVILQKVEQEVVGAVQTH